MANASMIKGDAATALRALLGHDKITGNKDVGGNTLVDVQNALANGKAVVLQTSDSKLTALGSGISANHAVAVLDVYASDYKPYVNAGGVTKETLADSVQPKDGYLLVLDPYGETKIVSLADIKGGKIVVE